MDYNKINTLLTDKRLSVPQLAEKIGMTKRGLYASIENKTLSISTLEKIAEVLEVPVTIFFENDSLKSENDDNQIIFNKLLEFVRLDDYLTGFIEEYYYEHISIEWFKNQLKSKPEWHKDFLALEKFEKSNPPQRYNFSIYGNPEFDNYILIPMLKERKYDSIYLNMIFEIFETISKDAFFNVMVKKGVFTNTDIKKEFITYWNHKKDNPIISKAIEKNLNFNFPF